MKERIFLIIGGFIVVGVIAYEVYKHFQNIKDNYNEKKPITEDDSYTAQAASLYSEPYTASATDVYETREDVAGSVKERHNEAAKAMKESLNNIFRENEYKDILTENSKILDKTSKALGDLLK